MNIPYHKPVLLKESIEALNIAPTGIYIDVTYGGGGHSAEIMKHINGGKLIATDTDADVEKNLISHKNFIFLQTNYKYVEYFLKYLDIDKVDGIIADLGVSSHHFDEASRGFSYRNDAQLDMRMNKNTKLTAKDILNEYSEEELYKIFKTYGEINNAKCLIDSITAYRLQNTINTVNQFIAAIEKCLPKNQEYKYLSKVFQALRIETNNELECLKDFLSSTENIVKQDGRLVIITYHSLEDKIVKNYMKTNNFDGETKKDFYGNRQAAWTPLTKVISPSEEEIEDNNRARSAKLRIAIKN